MDENRIFYTLNNLIFRGQYSAKKKEMKSLFDKEETFIW